MYHLRYHGVNVLRVQEKFAYTLQNQTEVQARVIVANVPCSVMYHVYIDLRDFLFS